MIKHEAGHGEPKLKGAEGSKRSRDEIEELTRRMRSDSKAGMKAAALEGALNNFAKAILEQVDEKLSTKNE